MSENLIACKACGQQIAKAAKTCPHCGAKNKKGKPVLIGILVIIVLGIIIGSSGGNDEPAKVEPTQPATQAQATDTQPQDTTPAATQEAPKEDAPFTVGETVQLNDVNATLVEVTTSKGSKYNKPTDGNVFVLCEFTIENNSDEELTVSSLMSFEAYCDDYACNYSFSALLEKENKSQLDGTIAPGKKMNGIIGYEVPKDWEELEIHFTPDVWSAKEIVFVATNS